MSLNEPPPMKISSYATGRGEFEVSNIREKNSYVRFISKYLHIYQHHMLIVKHIQGRR